MLKSSILKKVISTVLVLTTVYIFSVGTCFAKDDDPDDVKSHEDTIQENGDNMSPQQDQRDEESTSKIKFNMNPSPLKSDYDGPDESSDDDHLAIVIIWEDGDAAGADTSNYEPTEGFRIINDSIRAPQ